MKVCDFHSHVFPEAIAHDTVRRMAQNAEIPLYSDGTINGLVACMDEKGVDFCVTLPVATRADQVERINNWTAENRHPRIEPFGAMHPDYPDIGEEFDRLLSQGIKGIKLHPDYQSFYPVEERLEAIYAHAERCGLIILFHCGDDIGHPRPGHSLPRQMATVIDRHPKLTMVFAHMGGFDMWDQAEKYLIGQNVYLDTSYSFEYLPKERMETMIKNHGYQQILAGSDSPWGDINVSIKAIEKLAIPDIAKENILYNNALQLLGRNV